MHQVNKDVPKNNLATPTISNCDIPKEGQVNFSNLIVHLVNCAPVLGSNWQPSCVRESIILWGACEYKH
jgi:hypothetical protein